MDQFLTPISDEDEETFLTDREVLNAIYRSQKNVEDMVTQFMESSTPVVEALKSKGIMGLMGKL